MSPIYVHSDSNAVKVLIGDATGFVIDFVMEILRFQLWAYHSPFIRTVGKTSLLLRFADDQV